VWKRQDYKCLKCFLEIKKVKEIFTDYIIPLHENGINDVKNIEGLCSSCYITKKKSKEEENLNLLKKGLILEQANPQEEDEVKRIPITSNKKINIKVPEQMLPENLENYIEIKSKYFV
jgi:hypothetical protein